MISLKQIEPHKVSTNLRGYSVMFYGEPKSGKTTVASHFPNSILFAFEKGYNALPGVYAAPINSWSEFRKLLRTDLKDPEIQEKFHTIVIDTADIAYSLCVKYILGREGVDAISDIPYGGGYKMAQEEFDEAIRTILNLNYGLVLISHSTEKTMTNKNGQEYTRIVPTLDKGARLVCNRTCDIIGYATPVKMNEEGAFQTYLFMRGTPFYDAGSRFKYVPDHIVFNYDNLVGAIQEAIKKQAEENNNEYVTDEVTQVVSVDISFDYQELMEKISKYIKTLLEKNEQNSDLITSIVEKYLGKGKKVSNCTSSQCEQLELICSELEENLNNI